MADEALEGIVHLALSPTYIKIAGLIPLFWEIIYQILDIWFGGVVGEPSGTCDK